MYGSLAAFLSALVLATSVEYVILSQNIIHDLALSLFISIALFLFHRASRENGFTKITFVCFYAALGCAVLTKGPIGLLLPGLIIFLYLLKTKQWRLILNRNIVTGAAIFLIIALPWYIIMALRHDDYLQAFLIKGNIARFFSRKSGHREPFYFYIQMLAAGFFPWSVFIPSALYLHYQNFRQEKIQRFFFPAACRGGAAHLLQPLPLQAPHLYSPGLSCSGNPGREVLGSRAAGLKPAHPGHGT